MKISEFQFELPEELIATQPTLERRQSRLLCLDKSGGVLSDRRFSELPTLLKDGDLLLFNDTKVIPARLFGQKETGGNVEVLVERIIDRHQVLAHVRASKSPKPNSRMLLEGQVSVRVIGREGELFQLCFEGSEDALDLLEKHGRIPLPPYIERDAELSDKERYQTVYADKPGAVAAPTAGLHFDQLMLQQLNDMGIQTAHITLHVGAGTFQPVRVENILEHKMHSERVSVDENVCQMIRTTQANGGRVIAVGTTVVRSLETASQSGSIAPYDGETDIFIYPGYQFKTVDAMITNFHLPGSTLLMLVSAFAGIENVKQAYQHAIKQRYRFYSYGDAMFIADLN